MHERLTLRLKFWSISLYDQLFLRYKIEENRKCTKLSKTEPEQSDVLYIH